MISFAETPLIDAYRHFDRIVDLSQKMKLSARRGERAGRIGTRRGIFAFCLPQIEVESRRRPVTQEHARPRNSGRQSYGTRSPGGSIGPFEGLHAGGLEDVQRPAIGERMKRKLLTKRGRKAYARRKVTAEPVIGQVKNGVLPRFSLRGLPKVRGEFSLACAVHNLKKLWKLGWELPSPAAQAA